jgi:hypothetical protein
MKPLPLALVLSLLLLIIGSGGAASPRTPVVNHPYPDEGEQTEDLSLPPVYSVPAFRSELDEIGDTLGIGSTWFEIQHTGSHGRMLAKDSLGYVHISWANGLNSGSSNRHIYYNWITPAGAVGLPNGIQVDAAVKGGYTTLDTKYGGRAFPAFHQSTVMYAWSAAGADALPHVGAFLVTQAPTISGLTQVIWPKVMWGRNNVFHMISTEHAIPPVAGAPQRQYYVAGTYNVSTASLQFQATQTLMDWTVTVAADVATSKVSNKTVFAWTRCRGAGFPNPDSTYTQLDNDVYYLVDADGLNLNWNDKINLTNFNYPNYGLLPDTLRADRDTLRAYADISTFIDHNDYVHIAFTTPAYFAIEQLTYWNASIIWHWSSQYPDTFRAIAYYWNPQNDNVDCGPWNLHTQRPCLSENPATGALYCTYQVFDTDSSNLSVEGWPSGEVYVSKSTNGGLAWSVGTNITNTQTPAAAPVGASLSEVSPTAATLVDGNLHISYVMDRNAGNEMDPSSYTLNRVYYHRVAESLIPATPLLLQLYKLHVDTTNWIEPIEVTLTPINPPIQIPALGGSYSYTASAHNNATTATQFRAWCKIKYPNGTWTGYVLGPLNLNVPANYTVSRQRNQSVPGSWAAGTYQHWGWVSWPGTFTAYDSSFFTWTKAGVDMNSPLKSWAGGGELFPGEAVGARLASPMPEDLKISTSPNPFNPRTTLSFVLPEAAHVTLKVYDLKGAEVATLVDGVRGAGQHQVTFDGSALASGVYFYKLTAGSTNLTGKLMLLK